MYSVILMAAMSANGPDAVSFHRNRVAAYSCQGCYGCGGCVSMGCGGCYGSGCGGCFGGHNGFNSCWGQGGGGNYGVHGCYGVVAYGVYGCSGYHNHHSCFGQYGGTACYGGCYGSCMGCYGHYAGCHGQQQGCYGGCYGSPVWYGYGTVMTPAAPYHESGNPMVAPAGKDTKDAPKVETKPMSNSAKLIIDAPADAALYVDDMPVKADKNRQFSTPALEPGQTYYYTVRIEMLRDGKPVSESRRVLVRANEVARESFGDKATAVVQAGR